MNGKVRLGNGDAGPVSSNGGRLKDEFAGRSPQPAWSIVDGVALRDLAQFGAGGAHNGDAGILSFTLQHAGYEILPCAGRETADTEVGGVQQTALVGGPVAQQKDAANIVGSEAVKQFAAIAAGRNSSDGDANLGRISRLPSPEQAAGHEFRAGALRLP